MAATHRVSEGQRRQMIADAAYFRAERHGFVSDPVADWLEAEVEVDSHLGGLEGEGVLERLDERVALVNEKLAALRQRVKTLGGEAREEWRDDVEKLGKLRDSLRKRLNEVREQGEHASEKAQRRAEKIWDEISETLHRLRRHDGG